MHWTLKNLGFLLLSLTLVSPASKENTVGDCLYDLSEIVGFPQSTCKPDPNYSYSTDPDYLNNFSELIVPLVFWGINQDDGSNDDFLTKSKVRESVDLLNSAFADIKICFKLQELKYVNDSEIYWTDYYKFNKYIRENDYSKPAALNVYIPYRFTNNNNSLRGGKWSKNQFSVNMLNYNTGILPHEVGHIFGLSHTHAGAKAVNCEHVTRNEEDPDYNARCSGDRVTDTNAIPSLYGKFHLIDTQCGYIGNLVDCKGTPYTILEQDVRNFMAYTQHSCRSLFTVGQGIRVREFIKNKRALKKLEFVSDK
jgi:hypothetical protein